MSPAEYNSGVLPGTAPFIAPQPALGDQHNRISTTFAPQLRQRIAHVSDQLATDHPQLAIMFQQCYPNTLETTTRLLDDGTTFVFTGDIPAMWLRDSSAQVRPYVSLAAEDADIRRLVSGLIRRQAQYIAIDPYANAFNEQPNGRHHANDRTEMGPWIWERKFELDSLCYPIQLCADYWNATHDSTIFDTGVRQMFTRVVEIMRIEQRHDTASTYRFERAPEACALPSDTLPFDGKGTPINATGMIWSGFRPSDDACAYGFHIPSNMFAVVVLGHIAQFAREFYHDVELTAQADQLRAAIDAGIQAHGTVDHPRYGRIYAYETDGSGNYNLMDDANVPSLLSIPYLGYRPIDDPIYQCTRRFVLSNDNPCYYKGAWARGVGSPHTPAGYIWPIGLIMQGLTTNDAAEQRALLDMLAATTAGTNYMHESFDPDQPDHFTRPWFAWANSLFGEFVCRWIGVA